MAVLSSVIQKGSKRLADVFKLPFLAAIRKIKKAFNPDAIVTVVVNDVKKEFGQKKPTSRKDYFAVGNYYVAKKLAVVAALLILFLPLLYIRFLHPIVVAKFLTKTMVINSSGQADYSGKVRLLSGSQEIVLFEGVLVNGRIEGEGTLYDYEGRLLYRGGFSRECYEGEGTLYFSNGQICYEGGFMANQYHGTGTLYDESGQVRYRGSFAEGQYSGTGELYDENGQIRYRGGFAEGRYSGTGELYDENGQ
ncbi:MAG: hypothetical protein K2N95_19615, partial [Lachnospiraceae bacterium]|nr:hypothetical protein [Lachnospiraceae bacterium]